MIINDTLSDARFRDAPIATGPLKIRFYAGAPLTTASGLGLGTLCILDDKPRVLTATQLKALRTMSAQVA